LSKLGPDPRRETLVAFHLFYGFLLIPWLGLLGMSLMFGFANVLFAITFLAYPFIFLFSSYLSRRIYLASGKFKLALLLANLPLANIGAVFLLQTKTLGT
jgi:predicted membrane-bound spermidine synthase